MNHEMEELLCGNCDLPAIEVCTLCGINLCKDCVGIDEECSAKT